MAATLYYFPGVAGRSELIRLICAAGGIELVQAGASGIDKTEFGSPTALPVLQHGDIKMSQSNAIEGYLSFLAFPEVTAEKRAKDFQLGLMKEDIIQGIAKVLKTPELKEKAAEELPKHLNKWYPMVEKMIPDDGFINGLPYPTAADLAVLNVTMTYTPFVGAQKEGNIDMKALYPKMVALAERVATVPSIEAYIAQSETFAKNTYG